MFRSNPDFESGLCIVDKLEKPAQPNAPPPQTSIKD